MIKPRVVIIIMGALAILAGGWSLAGFSILLQMPSGPLSMADVSPLWINLGLAIGCVVAGIGVLFFKNWARKFYIGITSLSIANQLFSTGKWILDNWTESQTITRLADISLWFSFFSAHLDQAFSLLFFGVVIVVFTRASIRSQFTP